MRRESWKNEVHTLHQLEIGKVLQIGMHNNNLLQFRWYLGNIAHAPKKMEAKWG